MKRLNLVLLLSALALSQLLSAQVRQTIAIPDIPGYKTLKCDFHTHTIFSDGHVLPAVRVTESFSEGIDAVAITDHIEYRPLIKKGILIGDHNKSYSLAVASSNAKDVIVIKGCEITRPMPPGHWNAIFITDANPIDTPKYQDAMKAAKDQGAFMFWNHPGWFRQAPDSTHLYPEHRDLLKAGYMMGIEVANTNYYFPEAHQWALDNNLTMLGNTDIHDPIGMKYDFAKGEHRAMTLVFAKEHSAAGIREALDNQRTAAYHGDLVIGRDSLLRALFEASLKIIEINRNRNEINITVENISDIPFMLTKGIHDSNLLYFRTAKIKPHSVQVISVQLSKPTKDDISVDFTVDNFLTTPGKGMPYQIAVEAVK